jgi:tetratricopeptide (TPR) repeat protein
VSAWNDFGVLCKFAGWFDRGERAYARALDIASSQKEGGELLCATILHNIGGLEHARGGFDRAERPARQAWEIRRALLGENHPATLADAVAYAAVLDGLGRTAESRPIYEQALVVYERIYGPGHYEVAATLHNLAAVEDAEGNTDRAAVLLGRALSIKKKLLGADHPDTALTEMNLGAMLEDQGLLSSALAVFERALDAAHPHTERCRELLDLKARQASYARLDH